MSTVVEAIKKRAASINFTLALLVAAFAVYRGVDPCAGVARALLGVGVEELDIGVVEPIDEGPPLALKLVVELDDGTLVKILENGSVVVTEPASDPP